MDVEQSQQLTDEAIRKALEWAQAAESFVAEQSPLVVQEMVTYGRVYNTAVIVVCSVLFVVMVAVTARLVSEALKEGDKGFMQANEGKIMLGIFGGLTGLGVVIALVITALTSLSAAIMAWFAPRLYVIETLSSMLN